MTQPRPIFDECPRCGKYTWIQDHNCCSYRVIEPDHTDEEGDLVYAGNHEEAALRWTEEIEISNAEYGLEYEVTVVDARGCTVRYSVRGREEIVYRATEKTDEGSQ